MKLCCSIFLFYLALFTSLALTVSSQSLPQKSIVASPGYARANILQGEIGKISITVLSNDGAPFEILEVQPPFKWITAKYRKAEATERIPQGPQGSSQFRIELTFDGESATPGPIAGFLKIKTNSPTVSELSLPVSGFVRAPYRVDPTAINFGEVTPEDTAAIRAIIVKSNDLRNPAELKVEGADSSSGVFSASVKPAANKGEFEVVLQVKKDAPKGLFTGTARVRTNNKYQPLFEIPVKGIIK